MRNGFDLGNRGTGQFRRIRRRSFLSPVAAALVAALVALFVSAGLLAHTIQDAREEGFLRRDISILSRQLQSALSLLQDAESAHRALLLTSDPVHLAEYERAAGDLAPVLQQIGTPGSRSVVPIDAAGIGALAGTSLASIADSIRLLQSGQCEPALQQMQQHRGTMQALRTRIATAMDQLSAQGAVVDARGFAGMTQAKYLAGATALLMVAVLVLAALHIRALMRLRLNFENQAAAHASILNSIVDEIPASLAILDAQLRYRLVNKVFEKWRQQPRETIIGRSVAEVMGAEEYERSLPWLERAMKGETVSYEKSYADRPISQITASYSPMCLEDGTVVGVVSLAHDTTAHRNERERLQRLSERDALTGLLNRAAFEAWLAEASSGADAAEMALLYIDLDHFKPVNDELGHAAGDAVLREIADRLRAVVRPTDVVARLGGDEFAIGLTGIRSPADAQNIAAKVVSEARRAIRVEGRAVRIGASVGIAADASPAQGGGRGLVTRADEMLLRAKRAGRNRFHVQLVKR